MTTYPLLTAYVNDYSQLQNTGKSWCHLLLLTRSRVIMFIQKQLLDRLARQLPSFAIWQIWMRWVHCTCYIQEHDNLTCQVLALNPSTKETHCIHWLMLTLETFVTMALYKSTFTIPYHLWMEYFSHFSCTKRELPVTIRVYYRIILYHTFYYTSILCSRLFLQ